MEIQLRDDTGGLFTTENVSEAWGKFIFERGWWKISFSLEDGRRIRIIKDDFGYMRHEPIIPELEPGE